MTRRLAALLAASLALPAGARAQDTASVRQVGDSVAIHFVDADLRAVIQAMGRYLDRPVLFAGVPGTRVSLETPRPIPRADVLALLRGLAESQNLVIVPDSAFYRLKPREPVAPVMPPPSSAAAQSAALQLTVVRLRHARAADVAATLSALYGSGGADLGGGRPGTLSEELRRNLVPPVGAPSIPAAPAPGPGRSAVLEGSVTIVPDPFTNALLIRATAHDATLLAQAVEALDLRPLQVLIEVIIVEARRDQQTAWGLDLGFPPMRVRGTGNTTVDATQTGGGLGDFVLRVLNIGHVELDATLRAGASNGVVNILSRPVLLAANNHDARILVGSQRPFVQVSRTLATDNTARDQVVQYKDVGTRLNVRPTISADGYVTLEVVQEVSNATTETAFGAPVISTREAATQVTVRDGQTIVLGGLLDHQKENTSGGVPFLSSLPIVGGLFGRQSHHATDTELFLFLTPRVLRTDDEVGAATDSVTVGAGVTLPAPAAGRRP
jgi:general secretion pathway protein D